MREVDCSSLPALNLQLWKETPAPTASTTPSSNKSLLELLTDKMNPSTGDRTGTCKWRIVDKTNCCEGLGRYLGSRSLVYCLW